MTGVYRLDSQLLQFIRTFGVISRIVYEFESRHVVCKIPTKELAFSGQDSYRSLRMAWNVENLGLELIWGKIKSFIDHNVGLNLSNSTALLRTLAANPIRRKIEVFGHGALLSGRTARTTSASCFAVGSFPFRSAGNFDWS